MPWFRHWIEEETQVGAYTLTVCCQEMKFLVPNLIPGVTYSKEGKTYYDIVVLIDRDQNNKVIVTLTYCPNCGKRIQLKENNG